MRRILVGLALALLIASPVAARPLAAITAGDGPFSFWTSYATADVVASWAPPKGRQPDMGYWAKAECFATADTVTGRGIGDIVYAQFADLSVPLVQSGFTFGPTPSWSGGGSRCTITLLGLDNGAFSPPLASAEFIVVP